MKKLLSILIVLFGLTLFNAEAKVVSREEIPIENVHKIWINPKGEYFMTYYKDRELKAASISKKEVDKYYDYKQMGVKFKVILEHLVTKDRIVIKC